MTKRASYDEYVTVVFKWYAKLAKHFTAALESKEYMEVRNALHVLIKVVRTFPAMKRLAALVEKRVAKILEVRDGMQHGAMRTSRNCAPL